MHATNFKPRPKLLDKRKAKAVLAAEDRAENAKVKARSGGQCEVLETVYVFYGADTKHMDSYVEDRRCIRRASHVHHLRGGIGRRNVGKSIEAAHKLHVCDRCHDNIHGHVLVPVNATEREDAATVRWERVR